MPRSSTNATCVTTPSDTRRYEAAESVAGQIGHRERALGDHLLGVAQRGEGLGGPVHQATQTGEFRRIPHLPLEAVPEVVHGHGDHRATPVHRKRRRRSVAPLSCTAMLTTVRLTMEAPTATAVYQLG